MTPPDKAAVLKELRARVAEELRALRLSQREAQAGAIHAETRQEDPKDTRAIEAQYIARGFADRVESLQQTVAALSRVALPALGPEDPIGLGALVGLNEGERENVYFIVPVAGGETLEVDGREVRTLTPQSPLGEALCGRREDDDVELQLPTRRLSAFVQWVR